ncbi:PREDICTED: Down syndrome cell adhesion molecule-like protein 1 isoform X2 [Amphimedon queenslandica]|uniref:Uncharacterized protein n=1 Tax=Amphimedon queenslandica TaxID=400682 RepID=A0A1X7UQL5_AMPQE|nr:PREDICTED: Down syndrome cell adhesion molecule-like protein 1 isoform X2 [Amphimedon queenslandica]|eukprot:XP_019852964.1 PREDICTED: Down syndrome cell adhesion molecule-like protein 1 isoform X2 [Amphimedon queenslandica]
MKPLLVLFLCLLKGINAELEVSIHRIPDQPIQLYSGGSVVLTCTVTTSSPNITVTVEWFKSLQSLQHVTNSIHLSPPYRLQEHIWQSSIDLRVLTVQFSGWYYCLATTVDGSSTQAAYYQINVEESGNKATVELSVSPTSLYAQVPFTVTSILHLPAVISPQVRVEWYRNGMKKNNDDVRTFFVNATTVNSVLQVTEPFPASGIAYTCVFNAEMYGTSIFSLNGSTTGLSIESKPTPQVTILSNEPSTPSSSYSVTCLALVLVNGTLKLTWKKDGLLVKSVDNVQLGQPMKTHNSTSLRIRFVNGISQEDEGRYICSASLEMKEYDTILTKTASINILTPTRILSIQTRSIPSNTKWIAGSDASLLCTVQTNRKANVSISWETNTGSISTNHRYYTNALTNTLYESVLELQSVLHSELYYCIVSINGSPMSEEWYYLNVLSSSNFSTISVTLPSSSAAPAIGDQYNLTCTSTRPNEQVMPLAVHWTRDNVILHSHYISSLLSNTTHVTSVLSFESLQITDGGTYLCTVTFDRFFGATQSTQGSASVKLKLKAPRPIVTAVASFDNKRMTCLIEFEKPHEDISIRIDWLIVHNERLYIVTRGEAFEGIISDMDTTECGRVYSQYIETETLSTYSSVVCQVMVNGSGIISSVSRARPDDTNIDSLLPVEPQNVHLKSVGSHWIQIDWEGHTHYSSTSFVIEYSEVGSGVSYSISVNESSDNRLYTALLTDLLPATQYTIQVIANSIVGTNKSDVLDFTTNEAAPSGPPLNFSFHWLTKKLCIFAWSSPDPVKANGLIIGYRFQCFNNTGLFHDLTTNATSVSVNELSLNSSYTCSLAAFNGAGAGPSTMIVFYTDEIGGEGGGGGGGTSVAEGTSQLFSLTLYTIAPISVLLIMSIVIISVLAMTVCYYKQKYKKRMSFVMPSDDHSSTTSFQTTTRPTLPAPLGAPAPNEQSTRQQQRYVSSDTIQQLCHGRQEGRQDCTYLSSPTDIPSPFELTRIESTV